MAKINGFDVSSLNTWQELRRFTAAYLSNLVSQLNGNLTLKDNIAADGPHTLTFTGTQITTLTHSFGAIPTGFIVINLDSPITIYQPKGSNYAWQKTQVFLQSSGAGTATLYLI